MKTAGASAPEPQTAGADAPEPQTAGASAPEPQTAGASAPEPQPGAAAAPEPAAAAAPEPPRGREFSFPTLDQLEEYRAQWVNQMKQDGTLRVPLGCKECGMPADSRSGSRHPRCEVHAHCRAGPGARAAWASQAARARAELELEAAQALVAQQQERRKGDLGSGYHRSPWGTTDDQRPSNLNAEPDPWGRRHLDVGGPQVLPGASWCQALYFVGFTLEAVVALDRHLASLYRDDSELLCTVWQHLLMRLDMTTVYEHSHERAVTNGACAEVDKILVRLPGEWFVTGVVPPFW